MSVTVAALKAGPVPSARNVKIVPDKTIEELDADSFDMVILPGGAGGTENLIKDKRLTEFLHRMHAKDKYIAAICAAPWALSEAGLLKDKQVTCYPTFQSKLKAGKIISSDLVVVDEKLITSQGPGTAILFAMTLVELLAGKQKRKEIEEAMLIPA
jgi:4-methyl-5(b-hydroxyethyl)-thiazole monophosphate biosynthesis